jgi:hypothetical protein
MTNMEEHGRIEFGTDVEEALRRWGGYHGFADGVSQVQRVLAVMEPLLGKVSSCYVLTSGVYAAIRLAGMPGTNAITTGVGYVFVTPPALAAAAAAGADLVALLHADGLDLHQDDEIGKTIWNAQGRQGVTHSTHDDLPRRLCPNCFLQYPGDTCPDCDVALLVESEGS